MVKKTNKGGGGEAHCAELAGYFNTTVYANTSWSWAATGMFDGGFMQAGFSNKRTEDERYSLTYLNSGVWKTFTPVITNGKHGVIMEKINVIYYKPDGSIGVSPGAYDTWMKEHEQERKDLIGK